ncbi:hypothetical protein [Bacillus sp. Marseille-P3661]|uniref:hypothetical protein n=1 Tax=Bacillus sp. Marseille-P3661 TaxID=1936234 RepID=UPI000C81B4EA|nr:hypothetical protein [Bacillus sp. Marseille-P3661]
MNKAGGLLFALIFLTGCNASNPDYQANVENQVHDITEKVEYDQRKFVALEQNSQPPLEIREETINIVQSLINQEKGVKDSRIHTDSMNITISILVNEQITSHAAVSIGERAAQHLSSFANGGRPVEAGELGDLYKHYNLSILVGKNNSEPIISGVKTSVDPSISWKM